MSDLANADMILALFSDALQDATDTVGTPGTAESLSDWSARYPDLQADFAAIAVEHWANTVTGGHWPLVEGDSLPFREGVGVGSDPAWIADQVQRIRREASPPTPAPTTTYTRPPAIDRYRATAGLRTAAISNGFGFPDELAARLRLSPSVLEKLSGNQIDLASVPVVLVQQLAALLQTRRQDIAFLIGGPGTLGMAGMSPAMVHESRARYGEPLIRFADAIAQEAGWDDADRGYWQSVISFSRLTEETGGMSDDEL
jgi:hypothetical protein